MAPKKTLDFVQYSEQSELFVLKRKFIMRHFCRFSTLLGQDKATTLIFIVYWILGLITKYHDR